MRKFGSQKFISVVLSLALAFPVPAYADTVQEAPVVAVESEGVEETPVIAAGDETPEEAPVISDEAKDTEAAADSDIVYGGALPDGTKAPNVDDYLRSQNLRKGNVVFGQGSTVNADLPEEYSSVDEGYISPVRDQADSNLCWSFSAIAAMEADAVKDGYISNDTYLSPDATGYYFFNRVPDGLGNTKDVRVRRTRPGKSNYYDNGGNAFNTVFQFMQWMTPLYEEDGPFTGMPNHYEESVEAAYGRDAFHLENALWTASSSETAVKQLVRQYGAVTVNVAMNSAKTVSYNGAQVKTLYNDSHIEYNHAVAIIGWVDSFPAELFSGATVSSQKPDRNGAWICKNSYAKDGIFYLSYCDLSLKSSENDNKAIAFDIAGVTGYDNNYGYDGGIGTYSAGRTGEIHGAEIFRASANEGDDKAESIKAVGFATNTAGVSWTVRVYTGINPEGGSPTDGVLMYEQKSSSPLTYPGYYTVRLQDPVYVDEGEYFSIVVKLEAPESDQVVRLMYDDTYGGTSRWVYSDPSAQAGRSYLSKNGEEWYDTAEKNLDPFYDMVGSHAPGAGYVRIKAFTSNIKSEGQHYIDNDMVALVPDQVYTGEKITPDPQIYYGSTRLKQGRDYTVSYGANKAVGKGSGSMTIRGNGRYITKSAIVRSFNITKRPITDPDIEVMGLEQQLYTGAPVTPVTLSYNGALLRKDADYKIKYRRNKKVGIVTAVIAGKGNFSAKRKVTFEVAKRDIADEKIIAREIKDQEYKGVVLTPEVRLLNGYDQKKQLVKDKDYTVEYFDNLMPGVARILILGKGSYMGSRELTFNINGADLSKATITKINDVTYTGDAITPDVEVYYGSKRLTESVDYEINFANNINVGTATVSISGRKGSIYTGTGVTKTFNIKALSLTGATLENFGDVSYKAGVRYYSQNENKDDPNRMKVRLANGNYVDPSEYTVTYENNYSTGSTVTATMIIKARGDNLTGSLTKNFNIVAGSNVQLGDFTNSKLVVTGFSTSREYIYDAYNHRENADNSVKPALSISYKGKTLVKDQDYTLTYHNNNAIGTAYVTIEGINGSGYAGTRTEYYDIIGKPIFVSPLGVADNDFIVYAPADCVYNGKPQKPKVKIFEYILKDKNKHTGKRDGYKYLSEGRDYTLKYSSNVDAGVGKVTLTGIGEYSGTHTFKFNIAPAELSSASRPRIPSRLYTGEQICPQVYLQNEGGYLMEGLDYDVTYGENINAGTGTITYTARELTKEEEDAGLQPNYVGQLTLNFSIRPRKLNDSRIRVSGLDGISYTGEKVEPRINLILNCGFGDVVVPESEYDISYGRNASAGKGSVRVKARTVNGGGTGNFIGSRNCIFNIDGLNLSLGQDALSGYKTEYTRKRAKLIIPTLESPAGTLTYGMDYTIKTDRRKNVGEGVFTVVGKGGYKGSRAYGRYTIEPMNVDPVMITIEGVKDGRYTSAYNPVKCPKLRVKAAGKKLKKGRDYVVTYYNNTAVGTATLVVSLVNNYSGSASATFNII